MEVSVSEARVVEKERGEIVKMTPVSPKRNHQEMYLYLRFWKKNFPLNKTQEKSFPRPELTTVCLKPCVKISFLEMNERFALTQYHTFKTGTRLQDVQVVHLRKSKIGVIFLLMKSKEEAISFWTEMVRAIEAADEAGGQETQMADMTIKRRLLFRLSKITVELAQKV